MVILYVRRLKSLCTSEPPDAELDGGEGDEGEEGDFLTRDSSGEPAKRRFRRKAQSQIVAATTEMSHYYAAYFGLAPADARQKAADVVSEGVSGVFACE